MTSSTALPTSEIQAVLDAVGVPAVLLRDGIILICNQAWLEWHHLPAEIWNGKPLAEFLTADSQDSLVQMLQPAAEKAARTYKLSFVQMPDHAASFQARPAIFAGVNGCLLTMVAADNHAAAHQVELHTLMTDLLSRKLPLREKLEYLLDVLRQVIPYTSASISLLHSDRLEYVADRGLPAEVDLEKLSEVLAEPLVDPRDKQNSHLNYYIVDDAQQHPNWRHIPGDEYVRSWIGIPLRYEGDLIGILNIDHNVPGFYHPEQAEAVLPLARNAATAIRHAMLYDKAQEELSRQERLQDVLVTNLTHTETLYWALRTLLAAESLSECLPDILNMIAAAMPDTALMLVIFDPATGQLLYQAQSDEFSGDFWHVFCDVANMPDLPYLQMPGTDLEWQRDETRHLSSQQQAIAGVINRRGLMVALRPENAETFNENQHELIITIANQIALAVENDILYNQLQQYTQHLERIVNRRTSQLIVERRRLQAILDATAEGIFYMENFYIQYANPTFCQMVGYSLDELYGKPLSFIRVAAETLEYLNFNNILSETQEIEVGRSETRLRHRDGTEIYTHIRFSLVGQPGEEPVRMVAIARDIGQERELYFQRARFIANAAHELRTPISSIVLRLHLLRRQPEKLIEHLDSFETVTNYLRDLVEELLTLSRFERGTMALDRSQFRLQELIEQAVSAHTPFAQSENIEILTDLPENPIQVMVDGKRILQLIGNLVVNAVNYNSPGGKVTVKAMTEQDFAGNDNAVIEVSDDGIGIDKELLPSQIFEPFVRPSQGTRRETGMGLALAREIVHLHGGTIHARSKKGEGSTFRVVLPIVAPTDPE